MPEIYVVRADYGTYTKQFITGGYAAIGWFEGLNLSKVKTKSELYPLTKSITQMTHQTL